MTTAIPIIDVSPLLTGTQNEARIVASDLGRACREVGFFYIVGHGVQPDLRKRVFDTAAAFFSGPASIREAASFSGPGGNRGYIRLGGEALDPDKPAATTKSQFSKKQIPTRHAEIPKLKKQIPNKLQ